jgi:hypothetical protein
LINRRIDSSTKYHDCYFQTFNKVLNAFEWFSDPSIIKKESSEREVTLANLKTVCDKIKELNESLLVAYDKLTVSETTIVKRIEWASNSNPNLNEIIKSIETLRKKRNGHLMVKS